VHERSTTGRECRPSNPALPRFGRGPGVHFSHANAEGQGKSHAVKKLSVIGVERGLEQIRQ